MEKGGIHRFKKKDRVIGNQEKLPEDRDRRSKNLSVSFRPETYRFAKLSIFMIKKLYNLKTNCKTTYL